MSGVSGILGCGCNGLLVAIARVRTPFLTEFAPIYRMDRHSPGPNERPGQYSCIVDAIPLAIKQDSLYSPNFAYCRPVGCFSLTHFARCYVQRRFYGSWVGWCAPMPSHSIGASVHGVRNGTCPPPCGKWAPPTPRGALGGPCQCCCAGWPTLMSSRYRTPALGIRLGRPPTLMDILAIEAGLTLAVSPCVGPCKKSVHRRYCLAPFPRG